MNKIAKISLFVLAGMTVFTMSAHAEDALGKWQRSLTAGFTVSNGNTKKSEASITGEAKRTTEADEIQLKGDVYNSRSSGHMDGQKWNLLGHYSYNIGEEKMWFGSSQVAVNHDKFANIDYRISPALGLGRWISKSGDNNDWNAYGEGLLGYEMTEYVSGDNDEQPVAIAHGYAEKDIWQDSRISEDLSIIPSLKENQVRIKSETAFTTLLKTNLSLDSRFIYEYNSEAPVGTKDTDTRWITGLKYAF